MAAVADVPVVTEPRRSRPLVGVAIALAGAAVSASPYLWEATWRDFGFSPDYLPFHLWAWAPFAALAILAGWRSRLSLPPALGLAVALVAATLPAFAAAQSTDDATLARGTALPALLLLLLAGAWALQEHGRLGWKRPTITLPLALAILTLMATAVAAGRIFAVGDIEAARTFLVIATSIVIEALPFILLGAAVSAVLEVFVPDRAFSAFANLPLRMQVPCAALAGFAMPVCECGSVPVARRLILRGVHPAAGIAFMLASPIINPVVMLSTFVAYQSSEGIKMMLARAGLGILVALAVGAVIGRTGAQVRPRGPTGHAHHHGGRLQAVADHVSTEMVFMGRYVVMGAALAAALQTAVPQSVFTGVLAAPIVGSMVLMAFAFLLSLCSEADAFVAVSFSQFDLGPQLAFLVFGPILDIKLALLYGATFGRGFVLRLALVAAPLVLIGAMLFQGVLT
jgi:uncharacterized membrane protein YraQ (UPF0718 family)